ncbi:hypothetical protein SAMN05444166_3319 [Singulisphaera sp. GP187]|nr:hypothetical protein SAMN05444166_3319 [Singulisphaera sp. GP187]
MSADRLRTVGSRTQGVAEILQVLFQAVLEHRHGHVVHARGTLVGGDSRVCRIQGALRVDLVHQAIPDSTFDPLDEGRQHPLRPDRRFDPDPWDRDLSGAPSPRGHCLQWEFLRIGHRVSTSLHPFAPPELPGFCATMGALTPGPPALRILIRDNEHRLWRGPGLPVFRHRTFRSFRLQQPTVVPTPFWGFVRRSYRTTSLWTPFLRGHASIGLRHRGAGSPRQSAESSLLALRTDRSPTVASHPASRRRSYPRLRSARTLRQELTPCGFNAITGALPDAPRRRARASRGRRASPTAFGRRSKTMRIWGFAKFQRACGSPIEVIHCLSCCASPALRSR